MNNEYRTNIELTNMGRFETVACITEPTKNRASEYVDKPFHVEKYLLYTSNLISKDLCAKILVLRTQNNDLIATVSTSLIDDFCNVYYNACEEDNEKLRNIEFTIKSVKCNKGSCLRFSFKSNDVY